MLGGFSATLQDWVALSNMIASAIEPWIKQFGIFLGVIGAGLVPIINVINEHKKLEQRSPLTQPSTSGQMQNPTATVSQPQLVVHVDATIADGMRLALIRIAEGLDLLQSADSRIASNTQSLDRLAEAILHPPPRRGLWLNR